MNSFEEKITQILKGNSQKNALDFAEFLKANEMTVEVEHGEVSYKGTNVAYIHMDGKDEMPGPWTIWPSVDGSVPEGFMLDEAMKKIAREHVNVCGKCGGECAPGSRKTVYGKEFDNVCGALLAFTNPSTGTLECVKKLFELIKHNISAGEK